MADSKPGKIFSAIPAIIADVGAVGKTERNQQQNYMYRSADAICDALHGALAKHGVFCTCVISERQTTERQSSRGGVLFYTILQMRYTFWASDGSSVSTDAWGEGMDPGDKSTNKAMTAGYKYALLQTFCLMGHEDSERDSPEPKGLPDDRRALDNYSQATAAIRKTADMDSCAALLNKISHDQAFDPAQCSALLQAGLLHWATIAKTKEDRDRISNAAVNVLGAFLVGDKVSFFEQLTKELNKGANSNAETDSSEDIP